MSLKDGPGEGGWSVFAEKVVAERDKLLEENVALKADREKLLDLIEGFVVQDCATDHGYSSRAIGAYADGLRALVKAGRMEYVSTGTGRLVLAKWVRG